jgi:hypothetical protein
MGPLFGSSRTARKVILDIEELGGMLYEHLTMSLDSEAGIICRLNESKCIEPWQSVGATKEKSLDYFVRPLSHLDGVVIIVLKTRHRPSSPLTIKGTNNVKMT